MIEKIQIQNFKSIRDLELELGRVNVFIGENGSGKTNILEAIGVYGNAITKLISNNKIIGDLNDEIITSKGIRFDSWANLKSGFLADESKNNITIKITDDNENQLFCKTIESGVEEYTTDVVFLPTEEMKEEMQKTMVNEMHSNYVFQKKIQTFFNETENAVDIENKFSTNPDLIKLLFDSAVENLRPKVNSLAKEIVEKNGLPDFAIFCPENTYLRRTDEESHLRPIGVRGEGLLNYLSNLLETKPDVFDAIKENLKLISWFQDLEIYKDFLTGGNRVKLKDKFLAEGKTIGLRNANEGFLFVLFYITLFSSEKTPKFFAIDNFDNALNPKLCSELIKILIKIAKEKGKQVILTTHNPAVLDGLDLKDDEQRLFVVSRKIETGDTKVKRILKKQTPFGESTTKLSESFMNGSIGGLPQNF